VKIFNTVQELWDYCSFCPICQEDCRDIVISVGPDAVFELSSCDKESNFLNLKCVFTSKKSSYSVQYKIDCQSNAFAVAIVATDVHLLSVSAQSSNKKVGEAYFYFYLRSSCPKCQCASTYGTDLELDFLERKIVNIQLERESFFLLKGVDKFHITTIHDRDVIIVSRGHLVGDGELVFEEDDKKIELPMVKLDLSDQTKVVNKIKTLILFS